jgi:hypothetical protein
MQEDKNESGTLRAAINRNAREAERNYQLESIQDDANDMNLDLLNAGNGFEDLRFPARRRRRGPQRQRDRRQCCR